MELTPEKWTIRKLFKFEAAHRLVSSWSKKCQELHGHSYELELFLESSELNEDGMVIDFGKIKDLFKDKLEQFDHKVVLYEQDYLSDLIGESVGSIVVEFNPTAENMAKFFYELLEKEFYANEELRCIKIKAVRVHETKTGWAEYSKEN